MSRQGAYDADDDIVDFILGITFEIWEERGVELIHEYYAADCVVWGLDGITHGAAEVVDATRKTLEAFPDRRLLGEQVIWSGDRADGYYSSHRLLSTATNQGPTVYGPATGARIQMRNIADCVVENGVVTREWLVRDNMLLVRQLGADPVRAAHDMAEARTDEHRDWLAAETARVRSVSVPEALVGSPPERDAESFAWRTLRACWTGDEDAFETLYAPYCVLHRSPVDHYSGRGDVFDYYRALREALGDVRFSVDHIATERFGDNGVDIAARWTVAGEHAAELAGIKATGRPMFVLGVTHWRVVAGRIVGEMTVFDDLALLSQAVGA